jgi:hypothetical protein
VMTLTFAVSIVNYHQITYAMVACITPSIVIPRRPKYHFKTAVRSAQARRLVSHTCVHAAENWK